MRKEFNSQRIFWVHEHGRRFIVLEHQHGHRDVMWKRSVVAIQKFCYHGNVTSHFSSPKEMSTRRLLHVRIHCVWIFLFQSQGQENEIILVSLVRSNKEGVIGYLASMDRLCVAISRARCGLYLFGNHAHLSQKSKKGWKVCFRDYLRYTVPEHGYV